MTQIIDRRLNGKNKNAVNRQRFIKRFRQQIKRAVADAVAERSITDIDQGERINIPSKDTAEPVFRHGPGGRREIVQPGNQEFVVGDTFPRPKAGQKKGGGNAGNSGESTDEFVFQLSREEFLEFFFEDLALPDLVKTQLTKIHEHKWVRAGYTVQGVPTNINVIRSLKGALARRIALRNPRERQLEEAEEKLRALQDGPDADDPVTARMILDLKAEIAALKRHIEAVPFIDEFDLRYNNRIKQPKPITQAVMFCLMDVSGSMTQERKDIAKRFFILLYLFLIRNYEHIDVVFIRHHTTAKEVDEEEFFYSRESGGTVVSSALELMYEIISKRYPSHEWNIYAAQASDGDNWDDDTENCRDLLIGKIMPLLQYYAYIEIHDREDKRLWQEYKTVQATYSNFAMQRIETVEDIYPVFRELFKKRAEA